MDVRAKTITDDMSITVVRTMAGCAEEKGPTLEYIIPTMSETDVFIKEAVAERAMADGVARLKLSRQELIDKVTIMINRSRNLIAKMMDDGFIVDSKGAYQ